MSNVGVEVTEGILSRMFATNKPEEVFVCNKCRYGDWININAKSVELHNLCQCPQCGSNNYYFI